MGKEGVKIEVYFCKTNLDMYSEEQSHKLRDNGYNVIERYCLGFCGECMCGSTCLVEGNILLDEDQIENLIEELTNKEKERVEL